MAHYFLPFIHLTIAKALQGGKLQRMQHFRCMQNLTISISAYVVFHPPDYIPFAERTVSPQCHARALSISNSSCSVTLFYSVLLIGTVYPNVLLFRLKIKNLIPRQSVAILTYHSLYDPFLPLYQI